MLFNSSSLSVIRVVSTADLRVLIFLPAILIPVCASSSRFHCYSGVVRPIDQMTVIEKMVCYSQFPREGSLPHHVGLLRGCIMVSHEAKGERKAWVRVFSMVSYGEQLEKQGKQVKQV